MIYETLDQRIADAMKEERNSERKYKTNFWKYVKTEMTVAMHEGLKIPDDANETKILKSMLKRSKAAIEEFSKDDSKVALENLSVHQFEASELEKLLPKETDPESVKIVTNTIVKDFIKRKQQEDPNFDIKTLQRYTKEIIEKVKYTYPDANNGVIAGVVKNYIN